MSVYNGAGKLDKTIKSVLGQTFQDFDFIIINDGSKDSTYRELNEYAEKDKRIKIISNDKNLGLTKGLNKGIKESQGEYIARIDAGDWWDKTKLEKQIKFLDKNQDYILCGTRAASVDEKENFLEQKEGNNTDEEIRKSLFLVFFHPSIVFRNQNIYYREFFKNSQEFDLYLRVSLLGKLYRLPEVLTFCSIDVSPSGLSLNKRYYAEQYRKIALKLFEERKKYGKDSLDEGILPVIEENKIGLRFCRLSNYFYGKYIQYRMQNKLLIAWFCFFLSLIIYPPFLIKYLSNFKLK